ncbi:centrosomal protein of 135 kDa-like isoform X2 [Daktulosphaira vitifoliae]|uniref:centrosomal protein of 135 kDa-like isoform X2 n=1 Tax=Daktulosphaira vitifoliae TaxID=58002 RepID=UPI0021A9FA4F|nr:centrosomal protein of 135 kDa-like isoform X2 [Daktulosphaira vitifoliae]
MTQSEDYENIRYKLDKLGYRQYMSIESFDLVNQLVADLLQTTESLKHYKNIAQNSLEVARNLEAKSSPYIRDTCSLIQEYNKLQATLKELSENKKMLEHDISVLKSKNHKDNQENEKLKQCIIDLEEEAVSRNAKLLELGSMFLIPQVEVKKNIDYQSLRPKIQVNKSRVKEHESKDKDATNLENSTLKKQVQELTKDIKFLQKNVIKTKNQAKKQLPNNHYLLFEDCKNLTNIQADNQVLKRNLDADANYNEVLFRLTKISEEKKSLQQTLTDHLNKHCNCEKDMSFMFDINLSLEELKKKNCTLENEKIEYENKLMKVSDDQKKMIDKINYFKDIENDLMAKIDKLSEENKLLLKKLIRYENNHQKTVCVRCDKSYNSEIDCTHHSIKSNDIDITISKLRAERDEYLYEINCLKRQHHHEIIDLRKKIETLTNETLKTSDKKLTLQLEREKNELREKVSCLKREIDFLNNQLKKTRESIDSNEYNEHEYVKQLEKEKHLLLEKQQTLTWESANKQYEIEKYQDSSSRLKAEIKKLTNIINDQKCTYDRLERTLQSTQFAQNTVEEQLERAQVKIEELKQINNKLNDQLDCEHQEKQRYHNNITINDDHRESLMNELEKKTKRIVHLDGLIMDKEQEISSLHSKLNDASKKIGNALYSQTETEKVCDDLKTELSSTNTKYKIIEKNLKSLEKEKKRLQNDLDTVLKDNKILRNDLEASKKQTEDLKMQLQVYVLEIRRIEETLECKESERDEILQQFKMLNCEATQLESNNYSLESEARSSKTLLKEKEHLLADLERKLLDKEELISNYETQILQLTQQVASLESQLCTKNDQIEKLEYDLDACRNICSTIDSTKINLTERLCRAEQLQKNTEEERERLDNEVSSLNTQMERECSKISTLEKVLSESRQECMELTIQKSDLKERLEECQQKIEFLKEVLDKTKHELTNSRSNVVANEHEINLLKRQLNDVKFEKAKLEQSQRDHHSTTV